MVQVVPYQDSLVDLFLDDEVFLLQVCPLHVQSVQPTLESRDHFLLVLVGEHHVEVCFEHYYILIEHPASMTHASVADSDLAVPAGLIRISVGVEHVDDLRDDLMKEFNTLSIVYGTTSENFIAEENQVKFVKMPFACQFLISLCNLAYCSSRFNT